MGQKPLTTLCVVSGCCLAPMGTSPLARGALSTPGAPEARGPEGAWSSRDTAPDWPCGPIVPKDVAQHPAPFKPRRLPSPPVLSTKYQDILGPPRAPGP